MASHEKPEVNWLRKYDRSLVVPEVVFTPKLVLAGHGEVGGAYYHPARGELLVDGKAIDRAFGVIVVSLVSNLPATIAHEWRHHWQWHRGVSFDHRRWREEILYEDAIREYFQGSSSELDALRFQNQVAPDETSRHWLDLLRPRMKPTAPKNEE